MSKLAKILIINYYGLFTAEARFLRIVALQNETLGLVLDSVGGDGRVVGHLLHKEGGMVRRPFAIEESMRNHDVN